MIQVVTFLSPSWRSLNLWKGHVFTIPKRSPAELPGQFQQYFFTWKKSIQQISGFSRFPLNPLQTADFDFLKLWDGGRGLPPSRQTAFSYVSTCYLGWRLKIQYSMTWKNGWILAFSGLFFFRICLSQKDSIMNCHTQRYLPNIYPSCLFLFKKRQ